MYKHINNYLVLGFSSLWILIIFLDYWFYHPLILGNIQHFQYLDLSIILSVLGGGVFLLLSKLAGANKSFFLSNGIGITLLFFVICGIIIAIQIAKLKLPITLTSLHSFTFLGNIFLVLLFTYFITTCCYVLGDLVQDKFFSLSFDTLDKVLVKLALGILILSILLFLLGTVNLLLQIVIGPLLLILLGVFYKRVFSFMKYTFVQKIDFKEITFLGFTSFYLILLFISLVYVQNIRPFPFGFDALAIYLNVPQLISKQHGLISGYSPYYWSLFVTLGHILFNKISAVISLSVLGSILSGFCIFSISNKWISRNRALFVTLLFFSLPLVNFQSFQDVKTDLGLLFFMLVTVLVLVNYLAFIYPIAPKEKIKHISTKRKKQNRRKLVIPIEKVAPIGWLSTKISKEQEYIILLGLLSGMVLGIKLTGLILIFSVIGVFTFLQTKEKGFITSIILILFIILAGGLDKASGLRNYHFSSTIIMWTTFLLGLIGLIYLWIKDRQNLSKVVKDIFLYLSFVALIYLPWPIKNFSETGNISFNTLIEGKAYGDEIQDFINETTKNSKWRN